MLRALPVLLLAVFGSASLIAADSVRILAEDDWYPYSAKRDGKPAGFAVDLVTAAFASQGVTVNLAPVPYARGLQDVAEGKEIGVFDTTGTPELAKTYLFHTPAMFKASIVIYAPVAHPDGKLSEADLEGKKVGITNGYTYTDTFDVNPKITRDPSPGDTQLLKKLALNRIQYAVIYDKVANLIISENKADLEGKIKVVGTLTDIELFLSFSRKHPEGGQWRDVFQKGLQAIIADGTYAKIEAEWANKLNR